VLAIAVSVLIAMAFLALAEVLVPTGSGLVAGGARPAYPQPPVPAGHRYRDPARAGSVPSRRPARRAGRLVALLPMLRRLPRRIERIASAAEHGRLSVNVRLFADERDRRHVTGLLHQILLTALAGTAAVVAVMLLGTPAGPPITSRL
jgi:hypothetical protein